MGSCLSIGIILALNNNKNPCVYCRKIMSESNVNKYTLLQNRSVDSNKCIDISEVDDIS
jgi:hypothetical protein